MVRDVEEFSKSDRDVPSLKLTACTWKWSSFPFGMAYFQVRTLSFRDGRITHTNITRKKRLMMSSFEVDRVWWFFQPLPPQKWHMVKTVELFNPFIQDIHVCFNVWKWGWRYFPYKSCVCFFVFLLNKKWSFWDDSPTNSDPQSTKNSPEN